MSHDIKIKQAQCFKCKKCLQAGTSVSHQQLILPDLKNDAVAADGVCQEVTQLFEAKLRERKVTLDGNDLAEVVIAVHNRGPRIPPDKLESLFQPLVRGTTDDPTGISLGLGLFIVREIATAHGGTVDVTSSNGETVFSLRLPRSAERTRTSAIGQMRRT